MKQRLGFFYASFLGLVALGARALKEFLLKPVIPVPGSSKSLKMRIEKARLKYYNAIE